VSEPSRFVRFDHSEDRIPVDLLQYLSTFLRDHGFEQIGQQSLLLAEGGETTVPFSEAIKFLRTNFRVTRQDMPPGFERSLRGHVESQARIRATLQEPAVQQEMASRIAGRLGSKFIRVTGQTDQQVAVISYVTNFIGSRTKYIGPLRDEPKPLYPLEEVADPSDVGYRGEHTAAVLELNRWTWISFVPPERWPSLSRTQTI
jgi:hypothetical protein